MNILHLSDIHFGRNYECYQIGEKFESKERILTELVDYIAKLERPFCPEHILVTGDIAWTGKRQEYDEATEWFKRLLTATRLSGKDITFCVGNHDVNRKHANYRPNLDDNSIGDIDELYSYRNVHRMESCIYEYDRFCENIGVVPFTYPVDGRLEYSYSVGYKDISSLSKKQVRLLSFNTALLSALPQISQEKMWIGQSQIKDLLKYGIIPADNGDFYSIALFHHAERFLHPNEICEYDGRVATLPLLRKNVDLILCGHTETGGKPILYRQVGGGTLLTAGATYYNDNHPNAFSIIHIADIAPTREDRLIISPYVYDMGWKRYPLDSKMSPISAVHELPATGEPLERCTFSVEQGSTSYTLPIKKLSARCYKKDGKQYIRIDNREEVLRLLDITYDGEINGGIASVNVSLAPKMEFDVQAALERERFFAFTGKCKETGKQVDFKICNSDGQEIASGSSAPPDCAGDVRWIEILDAILKIETFFDVKCARPDTISYDDYEKIKVLTRLIDDGFIDCFEPTEPITVNLVSKKEIDVWREDARSANRFFLNYVGNYVCDFFGAEIKLANISVISGSYHVNRVDLLFKSFTYHNGDVRQCVLLPDKDLKVFFVLDEDLARKKTNLPNLSYENTFTSKLKNVNLGFIRACD